MSMSISKMWGTSRWHVHDRCLASSRSGKQSQTSRRQQHLHASLATINVQYAYEDTRRLCGENSSRERGAYEEFAAVHAVTSGASAARMEHNNLGRLALSTTIA